MSMDTLGSNLEELLRDEIVWNETRLERIIWNGASNIDGTMVICERLWNYKKFRDAKLF